MADSISTEPFGKPSKVIKSMPSTQLIQMYSEKCGIDVSRFFVDLPEIVLRECSTTGMRFWQPASLAGDEDFYRELSQLWPDYYQPDRWEYAEARHAIGISKQKIVEIGCGQGYFLQSLEPMRHDGMGLELNNDAIANKVTIYEVLNQSLQQFAREQNGRFDVICSFQVLEHVPDPAGFICSCVEAVRPGGLVILSTPNYDFPIHRDGLDAFDLPPHHLNYFTEATFERIADQMGLELLLTKSQVLTRQNAQVWVSEAHSLPSRTLRKGINAALRTLAGVSSEMGHTLVAVLRKPNSD